MISNQTKLSVLFVFLLTIFMSCTTNKYKPIPCPCGKKHGLNYNGNFESVAFYQVNPNGNEK